MTLSDQYPITLNCNPNPALNVFIIYNFESTENIFIIYKLIQNRHVIRILVNEKGGLFCKGKSLVFKLFRLGISILYLWKYVCIHIYIHALLETLILIYI